MLFFVAGSRPDACKIGVRVHFAVFQDKIIDVFFIQEPLTEIFGIKPEIQFGKTNDRELQSEVDGDRCPVGAVHDDVVFPYRNDRFRCIKSSVLDRVDQMIEGFKVLIDRIFCLIAAFSIDSECECFDVVSVQCLDKISVLAFFSAFNIFDFGNQIQPFAGKERLGIDLFEGVILRLIYLVRITKVLR
ncbi:hypothetical protein SDC9_115359 [bioreactor metagenome]|uniref:Uncharacterized protein n=1 Tax=bioreactor metagenome TaxID=1076179 RepID=A0A645BT84_9ZZZZ